MCARVLQSKKCLKRKIERKQKPEKNVQRKEKWKAWKEKNWQAKKKRTKKLGTIGLEKKEK